MKKYVLLLIVVAIGNLLFAQNVGIGTTTPNASAQLDIASTNKGLLLPRMSSFNRGLIINPANGLLVYDTTQNRMYQYQDGGWRYFINDNYWRTSTTRNWVYNSTDSVGIGTTTPTNRLDVNGNIRSRDDVLADGRVIATGTVTGSGLNTSGGLTVGSSGLIGGNLTVNGDLSTNSDLIINNAGATFQLRNGSNVNKGFFQLSGDNVRMGTNSGNSAGNLILRMNGTDRVVFNAAGDMQIGGKITTPATGAVSLIPLCMGRVGSDGTILSGTGNFTVTKTPGLLGDYEITCQGISINSIFFSSVPYQTATSSVFYSDVNKILVRTWVAMTGIREDHHFYFIVYK